MRRFYWRLGITAAVIVAAVVVIDLRHGPAADWIQHFFGFETGQGNDSHYLFWSGAGSDLAYLSFVVAGVVWYRRENCRYRWCPFLGHYELRNPDTGVVRKLCALHHPDVHEKTLTSEHLRHIQERRHLFFGGKPGKG